MRDRLIELLQNFADGTVTGNGTIVDGTKVDDVADHLIANGVLVIDTDVVSTPNRPLITQCMGRPIDEVINLIRRSEWISVEERLPENGNERVLVMLKDIPLVDQIGTPKVDTDRYINGNWVRWYIAVTHWMPLPEAPKMKGGEE